MTTPTASTTAAIPGTSAPTASAGWTPEQTRAMLEAYLGALLARGPYDHFFADDVVFSVEGTPQRAEGRAAVRDAISSMHAVAFDARPEIKSLVVDRDRAAVEADFVGTHTAEFAGIPASGRSVRVPYAIVYDVRGGKIAALRGYMSMDVLLQQLTS